MLTSSVSSCFTRLKYAEDGRKRALVIMVRDGEFWRAVLVRSLVGFGLGFANLEAAAGCV